MTRSELYVSDRIGRILEVPTPPGRAFVGQAKHTHWIIEVALFTTDSVR
jgi:hypothetical protein